MRTIYLKFDKTLTSLAGNKYGQDVFEKQVGALDYEQTYKIIFPSEIKNIATSFIQGFFQSFVKTFGLIRLDQKIEIESLIPNLKETILKSLD